MIVARPETGEVLTLHLVQLAGRADDRSAGGNHTANARAKVVTTTTWSARVNP